MSTAVPTGGTPISNLPSATTLNDGDEVIINRDGKVYRTSKLADTVNGLDADLMNNFLAIASGKYTALQANEDLNDIVKAGTFYAVTNVAQTLSNSPVTTTGFCMWQFKITSSNYYKQIVFSGSVNHPIYIRQYSAGTWSEWKGIQLLSLSSLSTLNADEEQYPDVSEMP